MEISLGAFELWTMKLSRAGYGDILTVKKLDIGTFMNLLHYENYLSEYQRVFRELNRGK